MSDDVSWFLRASGLTVWFWLRICHEVACRTLPESVVIWRLHQGWRICSEVGHSHAGKLVLAVEEGQKFLPMWTLHGASYDVPHHNITTWWLSPLSVRHCGLYALHLGVRHHDFHNSLLLTLVSPLQYERDHMRLWVPEIRINVRGWLPHCRYNDEWTSGVPHLKRLLV